MRNIHLIRHGESVWNRERRAQGTCPGVSLSDAGRRQANALGRRLRSLPFDHVYSSDALRALETARIALGGGREPIVRGELRELGLGDWEGRLLAEIRRESPGEIDRWYRRPTTARIEGGEDIRRFRDRVVRAIDAIVEETARGDVLVFTHGGVISCYLTAILGMDVDDLWAFSIGNTSITTIVLDFRPRVSRLGGTSHLNGGRSGFDGIILPGDDSVAEN